jgi:protein-tyrosine phosphatase
MQNTLRPHDRAEMTRHLSFERCFNFRDIGGYETEDGRRVKWRRLFRSMTPQWMTPADVAQAHELGIELVIDLRGPREENSGPLGESPARRIEVGPQPGAFRDHPAWPVIKDAAVEDALPLVLDLYAEYFAAAVNEMIRTPGPVLFHCSLGKDRTGTLAALILQALGVSSKDIVADYMLTETREPMVRALLESTRVGAPPDEGTRFVREPVSALAMQAVLHKVCLVYNDARGYLVANGVDGEALDAWLETLLEDAPEGDGQNR